MPGTLKRMTMRKPSLIHAAATARRGQALIARRRRRRAAEGSPPDYDEVIAKYAPGRSFADIGCMWSANGRIGFEAEARGASGVTAFDAMDRTAEFDAEHERRGSSIRFVRGDLHSDESMRAVGPHDVVWCTGVMYHTPNPLLALERLVSITSELLIVGTKTVPEAAAAPGAAIFFPGLPSAAREPYAQLWGSALRRDFDADPIRSYANWWWGFTPSAFIQVIGLGLDIVETYECPHGARDDLLVVARRRISLERDAELLDDARRRAAAGV